ncbi:hypothetical protein ACOME3_004414 [Neoechinorhynchus agilis]
MRSPQIQNRMDASSSIDRIKELLTCPICKGLLQEPVRIKDCFHAVCKSCLLKEIQNLRVYSCPVCDTPMNALKPWLDVSIDKSLEEVITTFMIAKSSEVEMSEESETEKSEEENEIVESKEYICIVLCAYGGAITEKQRIIERMFYQVELYMPAGVLCKFIRQKLGICDESRIELRAVKKNGRVGPIIGDQMTVSELCDLCEWDKSAPLRLYFDLKDERLSVHKRILESNERKCERKREISPTKEKELKKEVFDMGSENNSAQLSAFQNENRTTPSYSSQFYPFHALPYNGWHRPIHYGETSSAFQPYHPTVPFNYRPPGNHICWNHGIMQQYTQNNSHYRFAPLINPNHHAYHSTPIRHPCPTHQSSQIARPHRQLSPAQEVSNCEIRQKRPRSLASTARQIRFHNPTPPLLQPCNSVTKVYGETKTTAEMLAVTAQYTLCTVNFDHTIISDVVNSIVERVSRI